MSPTGDPPAGADDGRRSNQDGASTDSGSRSRLAEVFEEALDTPAPWRRSFVASACAGDPGLETRVLQLLAAHDTGPGLLDVPLSILAAPLFGEDAAAKDDPDGPASALTGIAAGTRIGPYRIERLIGRGGMGSVYLAERADGAFEQQVALKVVNAGIVTEELERRFLRERQILARLDHPGIAQLLHGGITPDGHPYLAMQLVDGRPITEWAVAAALDVPARLRLFLQVCEAVHAAHGRLIVHRDLKPSNIVVTPRGEVRLLDFGIARLLTDEADPELTTRTGFLLLTPEYAAPELLRGEVATTSTDAYALGVVLYELLTGSRPFGSDARSLSDLVRLADREPPLASRAPGLDPTRRRRLEGDLDAVLAMAMRREPDRRYDSVEAFADDLRAYLERRPVAARPDSRMYRLGRFARRHTAAVAAGVALALSLVAGLAGTTRMASLAREEAARSESVRSFLFSLWEGVDPAINRGEVPTARDLLDRGLARADSLPADAGPDVRADMLTTLGFLYGKLGEYERAVGIFERAARHAEASFGVDERTGTALDGLAQNLAEAGDLDGAEDVARRSVEVRRAAGSPDTALSGSYTTLGVVLSLKSEYAAAREAHLTALELDRRATGPSSAAVATDLSNLGAVARRMAESDAAERYHREALAIRRDLFGELHPQVAISLGHLGSVLRDRGSLTEAEALERKALAIRSAVLGPEHPDIAISLEQIGLTLSAAGRYGEADSIASEALELRRRVLGDRHPSTLASMNNLATVRFRLGQYAWAAEVQEFVADAWRDELGMDETRAITAVHNLGVMRLRAGDLGGAEQRIMEALEARRRVLGDGHPTVGASIRWLSELRRLQRRHTEAERLGREALTLAQRHFPAGHGRITDAQLSVGAALVEQGRASDALVLLRQAVATREASLPDGALPTAEARMWLGAALRRMGAHDEGRRLLEAAVSAYEAADRGEEVEAVRARLELRDG